MRGGKDSILQPFILLCIILYYYYSPETRVVDGNYTIMQMLGTYTKYSGVQKDLTGNNI